MSGKAIQAIDANAQKGKELPVTVTSRTDPDRKMKALEWRGSKSVGVYDVPKPMVTDPVRNLTHKLQVSGRTACSRTCVLRQHTGSYMHHSTAARLQPSDISHN